MARRAGGVDPCAIASRSFCPPCLKRRQKACPFIGRRHTKMDMDRQDAQDNTVGEYLLAAYTETWVLWSKARVRGTSTRDHIPARPYSMVLILRPPTSGLLQSPANDAPLQVLGTLKLGRDAWSFAKQNATHHREDSALRFTSFRPSRGLGSAGPISAHTGPSTKCLPRRRYGAAGQNFPRSATVFHPPDREHACR